MATTKTLLSIQIDFANTKKQAERLEDLAKQIDTLADSSLETTLTEIGAAWTGESAEEYLKKGRQLEEKLGKSADTLRAIAEAIKKIAQTTYNAERRALLLAQTKGS